VAIGAAASDRLVIVTCAATSNVAGRTLSSFTIGGSVSTGVVGNIYGSAANTSFNLIRSLLVTSGTTTTVAVGFSNTVNACGIRVYTITGLSSTTAFNTGSNSANTNGTTLAATVNIPSGGVCIGAAEGSSNTTVSWTNLTIDGTTDSNAIGLAHGSASLTGMSAETARSITATYGATTTIRGIALASWA
jgi:hypothetical protein